MHHLDKTGFNDMFTIEMHSHHEIMHGWCNNMNNHLHFNWFFYTSAIIIIKGVLIIYVMEVVKSYIPYFLELKL